MKFRGRALVILPALAGLCAPLLVATGGGAEAAPARGARGSLCGAGEVVLFQCGVGGKLLAVCGNRAPAPSASYRYGTPGHVELAFPGPGQAGLSYARAMYSGGGELQIRFRNGGLEHAVYSRTVRTGFGRDGHNNPQFTDGVMVMRGNRLISDRHCTTQVRSDGQVEDYMPEGTMLAR